MLVMVAVAFTVSGDMRELRSFRRRAGVQARDEAAAEVLAVVEDAFEGDCARAGAVVEEDGDAAAFIELDEVRVGRVDGSAGGFCPWVVADG